jgi:hypothetical protein
MEPTPPFWFKQRQCKYEPAGDNMLKITGPNLGEAYLRIERDGDRWRAALRKTSDGPDVSATPAELPTPKEAWEAAFELYRLHVIV